MRTRHDFATAALDRLFFAVVVPVLRRGLPTESRRHSAVDGASFGGEEFERSKGLPELSRVVRHLLVR